MLTSRTIVPTLPHRLPPPLKRVSPPQRNSRVAALSASLLLGTFHAPYRGMNREKVLSICYWASTLVFSAALAWSAVQYLTEAPRMQATMIGHLGYPDYFPKILAVFKLAGVVALLVPLAGFPFGRELKEWAYAGFTFDLIGACASHLSVGDSLAIAAVPLAFLVLLAASYWLWKRSYGALVFSHVSPKGQLRTHVVTAR